MASITLELPKELKEKIKHFSDLNWSAIARHAFIQKLRDLEFLEEFKFESKITEEDAISFGRKVNEKATKKYLRQVR